MREMLVIIGTIIAIYISFKIIYTDEFAYGLDRILKFLKKGK